MRQLFKIIFPDFCLVCRVETESYGLCASCYKEIEFFSDNVCNKCGLEFDTNDHFEKLCLSCIQKPPVFDRHISCVAYKSVIAKMIGDYKYHDQHLFQKFFVNLLIQRIGKIGDDYHLITSVPMNWKKLFFRDFNQSDYLANSLAKAESKAFIRLLVKSKNTQAQKGLGFKQRNKNLKGAIAFSGKQNLKGKKILLIDDVYTTGSTLNECAKVLKSQGADKVYCLTIAKTKPNKE
jgi:competence protein ComFC